MASRFSSATALLLLAASSTCAAWPSSSGPVALPLSTGPVKNWPQLSKRNADIVLYNLTAIAYLVECTLATPPLLSHPHSSSPC